MIYAIYGGVATAVLMFFATTEYFSLPSEGFFGPTR